MIKMEGTLSDNIKGVQGVADSLWRFSVADNDYRTAAPIKIQANGVYTRVTPVKKFKGKYKFALVFRCGKKGGRLKLERIIISGKHSGAARINVRKEIAAKFKYLKKINMRLL